MGLFDRKPKRKPGWYQAPPPDPINRERYWDGKEWTDVTRPRAEDRPLHDTFLAGAHEHRFSTEGSKTFRRLSAEDQARAGYEARVADPTTPEHKKRQYEREADDHYFALRDERDRKRADKAAAITQAIERAPLVIAEAVAAAIGDRPVETLDFGLDHDTMTLTARVSHGYQQAPYSTEVPVPMRDVIDPVAAHPFTYGLGPESQAVIEAALAHLESIRQERADRPAPPEAAPAPVADPALQQRTADLQHIADLVRQRADQRPVRKVDLFALSPRTIEAVISFYEGPADRFAIADDPAAQRLLHGLGLDAVEEVCRQVETVIRLNEHL